MAIETKRWTLDELHSLPDDPISWFDGGRVTPIRIGKRLRFRR